MPSHRLRHAARQTSVGCDNLSHMRVGCFTPLLSQFPLEKVFEKLKKLNISTVELGTGNYPGDPALQIVDA